ncbi:hypothetical protein HUX88_29180 [Duganella sp. BJB1802]|uniref:hypothetical protein n=1 Tax=unclassified Duganella TaxID=2636909 RepID=UPI0011C0DDE2|nr:MULTISPECIES: hypothetical protein [unclassified Duganella]NVD74562.1 hypothetical protein [Duganella sp. BJB1802]
MAFQRQDAEALEIGRERGLVHTSISSTQHGWNETIYKVEFGPHIKPDLTGGEFKAMLEALLRFSGSHLTVIWIDITTEVVHEVVIEAIERLWHCEPKLYVTMGERALHAPANPLPDRLQAAVEKSASNGNMWHPALQTQVDGKPSYGR